MYKVLIVDDETIIKIALRSIIDWEKYGFSICGVVSNGQEALELIERENPQLVITDIKMPVMDGIELIRQINERTPDTEVVVLSNYDNFENVRSALLLGASDYLLKVKLEEKTISKILKKIRENLDNKKQRSDNDDDVLLREQKILEIFFCTNQPVNTMAEALKDVSKLQVDKAVSLCTVTFSGNSEQKEELTEHNALVIKNTLLNTLQSLSNYKLLTMNQSEYVILHFDQFEHIDEKTFLQMLMKICKRFGVYTSINTSLYYHYGAQSLAEAKEVYHQALKLKDFNFYEVQELVNIREYKPLHYLNYTNYKCLGKSLYENKDKSPGINNEIIIKLIEKSREKHLYPEILRIFFIKVLDYLLYLTEDVPAEIHDYVSDIKDDIRICENKEALLKYLKEAMTAIFNPQIKEDKNAAYYYNPEVDHAISFIQQNYTRKISLDAISREVNLSAGYLCRAFKAQVGTTITNYINTMRLEHAKKLLQKHECSVKEVALKVGFDDPLYFSRLFKKYYQIPPSELNK